MKIGPISAQLQAAVAQIHEQTHSRKADAYLLCEATLNLARELHDDAAFIAVAIDYALVIDQQGYPDRSINILYEALQLAQSYHLFKEEGRLLIVIGRSVYTRAEYSLAIQAWAHALEVSELANDDNTWVWAKFGVGQVYDAMEDHATAITVLTEAKKRADELGDHELLMHVIFNLGVNLYREQHYALALENYQIAQTYAINLKFDDEIGELFFRMAEVNLAEDRIELAWQQLDQAEAICTRTHHIWALANIYMTRGIIYAKKGQFRDAHLELAKATAAAIKSGAKHVLMRIYLTQSNIAELEGDATTCLNTYKQANQIRAQIYPSDKKQQIAALEEIAGISENPGRILLDLANSTQLSNANLLELSELICKNAIKILKVDQASYWNYSNQQFIKLFRFPPQEEISQDELISTDQHPSFSKSILNGDLIIAHSVRHHQMTWPLYVEHFLAQNIFSVLMIPIRVGNESRGFLCFENCNSQHNWTSNEVQYASQLALVAARAISNIDLSNFLHEIATLNAKLVQNNEILEQRVAERTQELASAMDHLIQSEKLASLGNLVAGFAHELNTPLGNTLTASSTLLEKNNELIEQIKTGKLKKSILDQYLTESSMTAQLIERNARRASNMISNLKQVAVDTASSKARHFNLNQIVNETLITLSPSLKHQNVTIENTIPSHIHLNSYPGSLEQIITNLVNNAVIHAFTEQSNATIKIHAESIDLEFTQITISDNGCGMSDSIKSKVFDPFFTTKFGQGGSGLGLYLAYSLVIGTLGGQLQLETTEGIGSTFIITLPNQAPQEQDQSNNLHRH